MRKKLNKIITKNRKLENKVVGYITFFILFFAVIISLLFIVSLRENIISHATQNIIYDSKEIADKYNNLFEDYHKMGITLNSSSTRRIVTADAPPAALFEAHKLKRMKDGSIRIDDGDSGAFLAKDSKLNADLRKYFFFSKRSFELLGPIAKSHFSNFYFITEDNFIRITPKDWALQIEANHHFENDLFYKTANPQNNPLRSPQWTPMYYDSILKKWMTSLIIPVYDEDDFIGITGSDVFLDTIFDDIMEFQEKNKMYHAILFDSEGNILVHPEYQKEILQKSAEMNSLLKIKDINDPLVSEIIAHTIQQDANLDKISSFKYSSDIYYYSSQKLSILDWNICVYESQPVILHALYFTIIKILGFSLILGLVVIVTLRIFMKKYILKRISTLGSAIYNVSNEDLTTQIDIISDDEIGLLETGFIKMQKSIANQFDELKLAEKKLQEGEERFRKLSNLTFEGIVLHNNGLVVDCNESFLEMFDYTKEEIMGKNVIELLIPQEYQSIISENIVKSSAESYEVVARKKDGTLFPIEIEAKNVFTEDEKIRVAAIRDITNRKLSEKALSESEFNLRSLFNAMTDFVVEIDYNGVYVNIAPTSQDLMIMTPTAAIGKSLHDIFPKPQADLFLEFVRSSLDNGDAKTIEYPLMINDRLVWFEGRSVPKTKNTVLYVARDITERKQAEGALVDSERKNYVWLENSPVCTIILDLDFNLQFMSKAGITALKVDKVEEFYGKPYPFNFFPESFKIAMSNSLKRAKEYGEVLSLEAPAEDLEGNTLWFYSTIVPVNDGNGKLDNIMVVSLDTTQRKLVENQIAEKSSELEDQLKKSEKHRIANLVILNDLNKTTEILKSEVVERKKGEEQIKKDLLEKQSLLQELYHRTKNNMQVISSLLRMESRKVNDEKLTNSFKEITSKINTMSLVHHKLYQAKDLSRINLKNYISDLVQIVRRNYSIVASRVSIRYEMDDVFVLIDTVMPLGLALNELISNAYKHAFSGNKVGMITIKLKTDSVGLINLEISDNGVGLPENMDLREEKYTGMYTLFSLIEHQLRGEVEYQSDNGLHWSIKLDDSINAKRV